MKQTLAHITLTPQDLERLEDAISTIREVLPFLVGLTPAERQGMTKIGMRAQTFTEKAFSAAEQHPELVPGQIDMTVAQGQLTLFVTLNRILRPLTELRERVYCTQMLAGSEAYATARLVYQSLKLVGEGSGLALVVKDLGRQFHYNRRTKKRANDSDDIVAITDA